MNKIKRIRFDGRSGYCSGKDAWKDWIVINENSFSYKYVPENKTESNPERVWTYRTYSCEYKKMFEALASLINDLPENGMDALISDGVAISLKVTYEDGKIRRFKFIYHAALEKLFEVMKEMIPHWEETPEMMEGFLL